MSERKFIIELIAGVVVAVVVGPAVFLALMWCAVMLLNETSARLPWPQLYEANP